MTEIKEILWLFPILFIFHDLEEIILIKWWIRKNKVFLSEKFPKLSKRILPHFDNITTAAFSLGVAEEFIIITMVTVVSYITSWYNLWAGLFFAFFLHLVIHCAQGIIAFKYIPSLVTSIMCLPLCIYISRIIMETLTVNIIIIYTVSSFIIMIINLAVIHKVMENFSRWSS
ncbi:MAG: HXXEE domain-containing protein [Solirubrobacterales bacterium]